MNPNKPGTNAPVELQEFHHEKFGTVRTFTRFNRTFFAATDVTRALGYDDLEDTILRYSHGWGKLPVADSAGQCTDEYFLPVGDIHRLTTHSTLPEAEEFAYWIFDKVLTSIAYGDLLNTEGLRKERAVYEIVIDAENAMERGKAMEELMAQVKKVKADAAVLDSTKLDEYLDCALELAQDLYSRLRANYPVALVPQKFPGEDVSEDGEKED